MPKISETHLELLHQLQETRQREADLLQELIGKLSLDNVSSSTKAHNIGTSNYSVGDRVVLKTKGTESKTGDTGTVTSISRKTASIKLDRTAGITRRAFKNLKKEQTP